MPVSTLEQFLDDAKIREADFLKMDIEGAEHEVIHAASPNVIRRFREIAMEYHPNGSADALFEKLLSCGFVCSDDARVAQDFWRRSLRSLGDLGRGGPRGLSRTSDRACRSQTYSSAT